MGLRSKEKKGFFENPIEKRFDSTLAAEEASRCLLCFDAPCSKGCPAGTDPGTFIRKLRFKNLRGAVRTIKENNPFGWTCGEICPTERLCELECSRTSIDRPIQIGKLQSFLVEYGWMTGFSPINKVAASKARIAILGSGPAGLACARELAKKAYIVTVFEKREKPGGNLRYAIPDFRLEEEKVNREISEIQALGVEIKVNTTLESLGGVDGLIKDEFEAVFLSPGLWNPKRLEIDGAHLEGVYTATEFLEAFRAGKDSIFKDKIMGKTVAVIGGGSVAMDVAETALRLGPGDVYIIYRRSYQQMPAEERDKMRALQNGAHFQILSQPIQYMGNSRLTAIRCRRTSLGDPDGSGRRQPKEISGSEFEIKVDFAIEALATEAEPSLEESEKSFQWTKNGLIEISDETCGTSRLGVFAGGDIIRGPALVVEAVADGKKAAQAIADYLEKKEVR